MQYWKKETLLNLDEGRHLASEPHMRIQLMRIDTTPTADLFDRYHGELMVIAISGGIVLHLTGGTQLLNEGDQCLLAGSEPFKLGPEAEGTASVVQMIWSPGLSACKECWENNASCFQDAASTG